MQNEGLCENEHQLSVAGKIKKHFNTGPKVSDTNAGVSVISVSYPIIPLVPQLLHTVKRPIYIFFSFVQISAPTLSEFKVSEVKFSHMCWCLVFLCVQLDDSFSMQRSGSLDFYQHPAMYWIRYGRFPWRHEKWHKGASIQNKLKLFLWNWWTPFPSIVERYAAGWLLLLLCCDYSMIWCLCSVFCFFPLILPSLSARIPYLLNVHCPMFLLLSVSPGTTLKVWSKNTTKKHIKDECCCSENFFVNPAFSTKQKKYCCSSVCVFKCGFIFVMMFDVFSFTSLASVRWHIYWHMKILRFITFWYTSSKRNW